MKIKFIEIHDVSRKDFGAAMEIYSEAFPRNERHATDIIRDRIAQGLGKLYIGLARDEAVFMAMLWPLKGTDFILLDYMAAKSACRNKGIGAMFIRELSGILRSGNKQLLAEVEDPMYGDNKAERIRRVYFYTRNGLKELKDVRYMLPPLQGGAATEMILMIFPGYEAGVADGAVIRDAVVQIYLELYGRDSADPLLRPFYGSIGRSVILT